ncbi:MAG: hypothetical protein PHH11_05985 [Methylomonas sp.]|nr:hypothetical protein [Methylomonas sp.]
MPTSLNQRRLQNQKKNFVNTHSKRHHPKREKLRNMASVAKAERWVNSALPSANIPAESMHYPAAATMGFYERLIWVREYSTDILAKA